ncbi:MAG: chlorohydrolase [Planctomycetota bacterium]|nr:MAG: chlorohydrolase [Planctomycetota bacterium]
MGSERTVLKALVVFPVSDPPISGGTVTVEGDRIVAVGGAPGSTLRDLGNVAILPGFVNAHTHLEFSDLAAPFGVAGTPLPAWIRLLLAHRRESAAAGTAAASEGLRQCLHGGTTTIGEIATSDWRSADDLPAERPSSVMFHESIGPTRARAQAAVTAAEAFLSAERGLADILPGLSPHAPYTVHVELLSELVALSRRFDVPLAMHLAESREELELLTQGSGPFRELLEAGGNWDPTPQARLPRVLDYLHHLAEAPRALVIHGNYLDDDEIAFLASRATTMSVVYCPRTHAYFGHSSYPLPEMLAGGVHVALGTDSRASNPNLNMLEELRFAAMAHPDVSLAALVRMATLDGARALGLADRTGSLEPGKRADLVMVALGEGDADDPHELLSAPASRVVAAGTWGRGLEERV